MIESKREKYKVYFQPAFLICIIILAVVGAGMSTAIKSLGMYLQKEPIPLRKSLDLLDENGLLPYKVEAQDKLKIENQEIVKELGTQDYIQWIVEDTNAPIDSPVRRCFLFITYYPSPDKVPHVPEECYAGGGFQKISQSNITLHTSNADEQKYELH